MWIFPSITLQLSIYNVEIKFHCFHTVLITITVPSILTLMFTCAFIFTMWIFSRTLLYNCLNTMFTLNIHCYLRYCLQLLCPEYLFCCLHMLSFSQCEDFSTHYCTIVYIKCLHWIFTVTYGTVYNYSAQYSVCAVYISFLLQCDIFSQSLPIWLYNNVYSISVTYTYSTICNFSPQYTYFDVYMCFHFHNVNIFPHITVQLSKYNVYIEYSLLPTVLFTIMLPSILILLLTYAFLFTM